MLVRGLGDVSGMNTTHGGEGAHRCGECSVPWSAVRELLSAGTVLTTWWGYEQRVQAEA